MESGQYAEREPNGNSFDGLSRPKTGLQASTRLERVENWFTLAQSLRDEAPTPTYLEAPGHETLAHSVVVTVARHLAVQSGPKGHSR